ncbi:hypothetical protein HYV89_01055 [Candidatus Woesearchaeota archaeon]|nr:hypothetical protein [Candidatus Woesearchaeota archaeon]MBI4156981.1 hypothetical protein [Candidatus Woesearchaeota archaeon]
MKPITKLVSGLEERFKRFEEVYRLELEAELNKINPRIKVNHLDSYDNHPAEDDFFKIITMDNDVGVIFPIRRFAYIKYGMENGIKEVLERRNYHVSIESSSLSPLGYIKDFQRYSRTE